MTRRCGRRQRDTRRDGSHIDLLLGALVLDLMAWAQRACSCVACLYIATCGRS